MADEPLPEMSPVEIGLALGQAGAVLGALVHLLNAVPATAPAAAAIAKQMQRMHALHPTAFSVGFVDERAIGALLAAPPAGTAD